MTAGRGYARVLANAATTECPQTLQRSWRAVRRKPTGVGSLRALYLPSAVLTEGDLANSTLQRAGMRKIGGLTLAARRSAANRPANCLAAVQGHQEQRRV